MVERPRSEPRHRVGCVHGRFQPFHLGHLEYVVRAHEVCDTLYIGLTNADPTHTTADAAAQHRHLLSSNPFPYYARMEMILGALLDEGVELSSVRFVPFPINRPELLSYYVPGNAVQLLTIYDEWGETKLQLLKRQGLTVEVMWRRTTKLATGTQVRDLLRRGESVSHLVPPFVDRYLRSGAVALLSETA